MGAFMGVLKDPQMGWLGFRNNGLRDLGCHNKFF